MQEQRPLDRPFIYVLVNCAIWGLILALSLSYFHDRQSTGFWALLTLCGIVGVMPVAITALHGTRSNRQ